MRSSLCVLVAGLAAVVFSGCILAQTAKQNGAAVITKSSPDLSGVWAVGRRSFKGDVAHITPENDEADEFTYLHSPYPMQPWAEDKFNYNRDPKSPYLSGRTDLNPSYANCAPHGPTVQWLFSAPFEIIQSPKRVLIIFEQNHEMRQIWTDGREQVPADWGHTWMGHSVGHWEGDTLVIDTIGLNDLTWLDHAGHVHSDALHLVERLQRVDHDNLMLNITFDDPKTFTKPFSSRRRFQLKPNMELEEDTLCEDRIIGHPIPLR